MPRLRRLEIEVGDDGSHGVTHTFHAEPTVKSGRMNGGLAMDTPKDAHHSFGNTPEEHARLATHLHSTLGLGGPSPERDDPKVKPNQGTVAPKQAAQAETHEV